MWREEKEKREKKGGEGKETLFVSFVRFCERERKICSHEREEEKKGS